jgi:hypothetical protein
MGVMTFTVPILPGRTEDWKQAVAEMKGPRREAYADSRRKLGIRREVVSLQRTPDGDVVVVFVEGDDLDTLVAREAASDHPFDQWFMETIMKGTHGMDPAEGPPPVNEVHIDWSD